jgi:hypothetical protein
VRLGVARQEEPNVIPVDDFVRDELYPGYTQAFGTQPFVAGPCAHICFGSFRRLPYVERTYRWLFPALLHANVQGLSLEFGAREMAEIDLVGK